MWSKSHSNRFRHNQAYPGIIHAYSEPCVTLAFLELWYIQNSDIFSTRSIYKTLAYSQLWYIKNTSILRTLVCSKSKAYSELYQTCTIKHFAKIVNIYYYFHKFTFTKLATSSISWNKRLEVVSPEVVILL